jgi:DNA (cytosine-5)-methyltransferase 1
MDIVGVDFFCGIGGLTYGLQQAGVRILCGIDTDTSAEETYVRNNKTMFINADINDLPYRTLQSILRSKTSGAHNRFIVFSGCAPCQPYSKINRSRGAREETNILLRFGDFIERFRPHFVISENVPQIRNQQQIFRRFLKKLENSGYKISFALVNAKDFGVPQTRLRLVLMASRVCEISIPKGDMKCRTVREAIAHYPPIELGAMDSRYPNHSAMKLSPINQKRIAATPPDGGDSRSWPPNLRLVCRQSTKGYYDVYGRMSWDKPAPTLTTRCVSYSNGRFGHPEQDRAISVREAAAIQSFPDDFVFYGTPTDAARHIGNAVPPRLANALGCYIVGLARTKYNRRV